MAVILGNGGHARVLHSMTGYPMLGPDDPVPPDSEIVIGVGKLQTRRALFEQHSAMVIPVRHPQIWYAGTLFRSSRGFQIMHGVIIQTGCHFGDNVLLNTGCQIDHDCIIGDHCIVSPGAILCGGVTLGPSCQIGAGAIIVQGVTLAPETIVPAGTLVVGQNDMRRPQRVVPDRASAPVGGADGIAFAAERIDLGSDPDL